MKWADHVGRFFRFFGARYECVEYDPAKGLRMVLRDELHEATERLAGDETWVSERAIGRTYHLIPEIEELEPAW